MYILIDIKLRCQYGVTEKYGVIKRIKKKPWFPRDFLSILYHQKMVNDLVNIIYIFAL